MKDGFKYAEYLKDVYDWTKIKQNDVNNSIHTK